MAIYNSFHFILIHPSLTHFQHLLHSFSNQHTPSTNKSVNMQFTQTLAVVLFAAYAHATCTIGIVSSDPNCCWGGDQGSDACSRQYITLTYSQSFPNILTSHRQGGNGCFMGSESGNFCMNMGIPNSKCVSTTGFDSVDGT